MATSSRGEKPPADTAKHSREWHEARRCLRLTLRDLMLSVAAERPMSLPNAIRLCKRRLAALGSESRLTAGTLEALIRTYCRKQPFRGPDRWT
jgi:hypothetical protein